MIINNPTESNLSWRRMLAVMLVTAILPTTAVQARDREQRKLPGYVDGSKLAELAKDDGTLVEVNVSGELLKVLANAVNEEDKHVSGLLAQIESVSAVVVEVEDSDQAAREMRKISEQLKEDDWENIARVREDDSQVNVSVMYDDDVILGIVVMVMDDNELVFANIAGRIDLALISSLAGAMDIPGLEELAGINLKKAKKSRSRD